MPYVKSVRKDKGFRVVENGKPASTALQTVSLHVQASEIAKYSPHEMKTGSNIFKQSLKYEFSKLLQFLLRIPREARGDLKDVHMTFSRLRQTAP